MNTPRWLRLGSWFAVAAWALGIFILSSISGTKLNELNAFEFSDKAAHFIAFATGAVLLVIALRWNTGWPWPRIVLWTIIAIAAYGALDEWHQLYTPNRSGADPQDWLADTLGAVAGASITSLIHVRFQRKNRPAPAGA